MFDANFVFIGPGRITTSLVMGLIHAGHPVLKLCLVGLHQKPLVDLQERLKKTMQISSAVNIATWDEEDQIDQALDKCDAVVLAVKPKDMSSVCSRLAKKQHLLTDTTVISLAAGLSVGQLSTWLEIDPTSIVRAMPNTPSALGYGMTGLYAERVSHQCRQTAEQLFDQVGKTLWVDEEQLLDVITVLSGSGPAYIFYWIKQLADSARSLGLQEPDAVFLAKGVALGAAHLIQQQGVDRLEALETLIAQVASPGGTTARALEVLEAHDFKTICCDMLKSAMEVARRSSQIENF